MGKVLKWLAILAVCLGSLFFLGMKWQEHMVERNFDYLEPIYPVENLEQLFDVFKGGFNIRDTFSIYEPEREIMVIVDAEGNGHTKQIDGKVKVLSYKNNNKETIEEYSVEIRKGQIVVPENKQTTKYLKQFKFLVTTLEFDKTKFKRQTAYHIIDNPSWGRYGEYYLLGNATQLLEKYGQNDISGDYTIEFLKPLKPEKGETDISITISGGSKTHIDGVIIDIGEHFVGFDRVK